MVVEKKMNGVSKKKFVMNKLINCRGWEYD